MPILSVYRQAHFLLKRVVAAGLAERFQFREVCPTDLAAMSCGIDWLEEHGYAERVHVACGKWYWRLTEAGVKAGKSKRPPKEVANCPAWKIAKPIVGPRGKQKNPHRRSKAKEENATC